jgi:hypothetical protein
LAKYSARTNSGLANLICPAKCLGSLATADLSGGLAALIKSSLASSTWATYTSGWKSFKDFEMYAKQNFQLPLALETVRAYVIWSVTVKKLKSSTVKLYLSSIRMAHTLLGHQSEDFCKDKLISMLLTGAENIEPPKPRIRRAMNMDLLMILGHRIASSNWSKISKQVVWAACTVSFFCSARLGEILAAQRQSFDRGSTLTWQNVMFIDRNEAILFLPSTKTSAKGDFIDLFPLPGSSCCPVAALRKLKELQVSDRKDGWEKGQPVFTFSSGSYLTVSTLNNLLRDLLRDVVQDGADIISAHSFRAAIPSAIGACPDKFQTSELKEWSRWRGSSYVLYCRSYRDQRRKLFEKIVAII